jgi:polysaccharide biosynthesis/export protein
MQLTTKLGCLALNALVLAGCSTFLPTIGPSRRAIEHSSKEQSLPPVQVIDVNEDVTERLVAQRSRHLFSEVLASRPDQLQPIGGGDILTVSIWEATPATLFGSVVPSQTGMPAPTLPTTLPEQPVDGEGCITVPFAGRVPAAGKTLPEIAAEIKQRLSRKANQPEVLVLLTRNVSSTVTVVGEVTTSTRVPLTPAHERLLDALAFAAGVKQPVNKTTIQVTRGDSVYSLPLETIIQDPQQNVPLQSGDVVTALYQPLSFTALGATGKNDEINFETQGISLAQALARSGALVDSRSNPSGVFVFRLEPKGAQASGQSSVSPSARGTVATATTSTIGSLVPVVYRVDLKNPRSLFWIQNFPIRDKDVLYVSNAPAAELEKFLNLLFTFAYPVLTGVQLTR